MMIRVISDIAPTAAPMITTTLIESSSSLDDATA